MNIEAIVISAAGFIIVTLLGVVAYFMKRQNEALYRVEEAVENLNKASTKLEISQEKNSEICLLKHSNLDRELKEIKQRISKLENDNK